MEKNFLSTKKHAVLLLLLAGCIFLGYVRSVSNEFVYDDHFFIERNESVKNLKNIFCYFYDINTYSAMSGLNKCAYRPLTTLSFAVDFAVAGLNPWYYRIVNISLHIMNTFLLICLAYLLGSGVFGAYVAGVIFAFFPTNVQSFVWISGRSNVLSVLFILMTVTGFVLYTKNQKRLFLWLSSGSLFLAVFCRESAVMAPLFLAAYIAFYRLPLKVYMKKLIFFYAMPCIAFALLRLLLIGRIGQASYVDMGFLRIAATPFILFAKYFEILLFPFDMHIIYSGIINSRLSNLGFFLPLSGILVILYIVLIAATFKYREKLVSFGMVWIPVALLPVVNIVPIVFYLRERQLYLPLIGFSLIVGAVFQKINFRKGVHLAPLLLLLFLLSAYVVEINKRISIWHDDTTLWDYAAGKDPSNLHSYECLSEALTLKREYNDAIMVMVYTLGKFKAGIQRSRIYNRMGVISRLKGEHEYALRCFENAVLSDNTNALAHYNIAKHNYMKGIYQRANHHLSMSLDLCPDYPYALKLKEQLAGKE